MTRSRSSIFSSNTLDLSGPRPRGVVATALVALALVLVGEWFARAAVAPIGDRWQYWDAAAAPKFSVYRTLVQEGRTPDVVIVGDSTAARDIDPAHLPRESGGAPTAYNLAWPANFPLAFRWTTAPLLEEGGTPPRVVVVSLAPTGFLDDARVQRFEAGVLSSPYVRIAKGDSLVAEWSYLARVRRSMPWRAAWFGGAGLEAPDAAGAYMPLRAAPASAEARDDEPAVRVQLSEERLDVLAALFRTGQDRGFRILLVIPPRIAPSSMRLAVEAQYLAWIRSHAQLDHVELADLREPEFLDATCFADAGHLNPVGAKKLSKHLAPRVRALIE